MAVWFPLRSYGKKICDDDPPEFSNPKILGYFSNGRDSWSPNASQMNYFYPSSISQKNVHFNLNHGIETMKLNEHASESIDHLLKWIILNNEKISSTVETQWRKWIQPDFVVTRGQLKRIINSVYNPSLIWKFRVVKFKGTLYFCQLDTEQEIAADANMSIEEKKFTSWGYQFEKYVLTPDPQCPPNPDKSVNAAESFCCIFQTYLNDKNILYGAEMDGVVANEKFSEPLPLDKLKFVELKTTRVIRSHRDKQNFEKFKLFNWWCQSFLVGIENIICGFRNRDGIIDQIEKYNVSEIQEKYQQYWKGENCINFLDDFLQFVKNKVNKDYSQMIYIFEKTKFGDIKMTTAPPDPELSFLPTWFTESEFFQQS